MRSENDSLLPNRWELPAQAANGASAPLTVRVADGESGQLPAPSVTEKIRKNGTTAPSLVVAPYVAVPTPNVAPSNRDPHPAKNPINTSRHPDRRTAPSSGDQLGLFRRAKGQAVPGDVDVAEGSHDEAVVD